MNSKHSSQLRSNIKKLPRDIDIVKYDKDIITRQDLIDQFENFVKWLEIKETISTKYSDREQNVKYNVTYGSLMEDSYNSAFNTHMSTKSLSIILECKALKLLEKKIKYDPFILNNGQEIENFARFFKKLLELKPSQEIVFDVFMQLKGSNMHVTPFVFIINADNTASIICIDCSGDASNLLFCKKIFLDLLTQKKAQFISYSTTKGYLLQYDESSCPIYSTINSSQMARLNCSQITSSFDYKSPYDSQSIFSSFLPLNFFSNNDKTKLLSPAFAKYTQSLSTLEKYYSTNDFKKSSSGINTYKLTFEDFLKRSTAVVPLFTMNKKSVFFKKQNVAVEKVKLKYFREALTLLKLISDDEYKEILNKRINPHRYGSVERSHVLNKNDSKNILYNNKELLVNSLSWLLLSFAVYQNIKESLLSLGVIFYSDFLMRNPPKFSFVCFVCAASAAIINMTVKMPETFIIISSAVALKAYDKILNNISNSFESNDFIGECKAIVENNFALNYKIDLQISL